MLIHEYIGLRSDGWGRWAGGCSLLGLVYCGLGGKLWLMAHWNLWSLITVYIGSGVRRAHGESAVIAGARC